MKEKKSIKISLATVLLFVAIFIIVFMAYYIYTKDNLQGKIDNISNTIHNSSSTLDSNVDTDESLSQTGTYTNKNIKLTFDKTNFNIYLNENFSLNGHYEIVDNKIVVCNITEYTFNSPKDILKHDIDKNKKWTISFNIKNKKSLEVKEIILPNMENEIIITIFNLISTGDNFLLQK